jgi:hypothetical protein
VPGILEGRDLGFRLLPALVLEQHVVGAVGIERRVEIDQVDRFVRDMLAQDRQVVAVEEGILGDGLWAFLLQLI